MRTVTPENQRRNEIILKLAGKTSYGVIAHRLGISRNVVAGVVTRAKQQGWKPPRRMPIERLAPVSMPGETNPFAKLNDEAVRLIRSSRKPAKDLARKFGVCLSRISAIRRGEAWKHVTLEAAE